MEDMGDTVEISGEGAAKAVTDTSVDAEEKTNEENGEAVPAKDTDTLQAELDRTKDRLLRHIAEFQNYRRRTEQEKNMLVQAGKVQVVQQILEIFDDFTRSIEATHQLESQQEATSPLYEKLKEGVLMVYEKFNNELERLGVEPIEAVGRPFNENEHEALMQLPAPDDVKPGIVIDEIQKGYRMGERVLRHSRVVVAS